MPVRIRVRNFQSIEDAEIEVSGLTVVTGQNNSGKSALMRAVRGVFENNGGDSFVRNGTDALSVHIDFGDANVTWTKGPKVKPTYVVGGKTIHPGRAVPDEVRDLGVVPVQAGSGEAWPQIAPQFTGQMFLLDLPGSAIAEVVSDVDRVSKLTEALRYADSDKRSANAELKIRRRDKINAEADLARFDGLDVAGDAVASASTLWNDTATVERELESVRQVATRFKTASAKVTSLAGVAAVAVPVSDGVLGVGREVELARRLSATLRKHRATLNTLPKNVAVPTSAEATELSREIALVTRLQRRVHAARDTVNKLPAGVAVPAAQTAQHLSTEVSAVRGLARRLKAAKAATARLEGLALTVPDTTTLVRYPAALEALTGMRNKVRTARSTVEALTVQVQEAVDARNLAQAELEALIQEMGVCPTCGSSHDGKDVDSLGGR